MPKATMRTIPAKLWCQILSSLLFLALAAGVQAANTNTCPPMLPHTGTLSPSEAMKMIREHKNLTVVDVRTTEEFENGHIPGAISVPVQSLPQNMKAIPAGPILLVCRNGRRAHYAYHLIHDERPAQPLWYLEGHPVYSPDGTYTFQ